MKYTLVRQPIVEGLFYPSDQLELNKKIDELLLNNPGIQGSGNRLVLPHGGWDYTGSYLGMGFNSLPKRDYKRVVIISNVHREFSNSIIVPEAEYFQISENKIKIDLDGIKTVQKVGKHVVKSNIPHMEEHGIEVVLPFISHLYPKAKIVPILLGKTVVSLVRNLSNIIEHINSDETLIIITSNFSDYSKEEQALESGKLGVTLSVNGKMGELIELSRTNKLKTCGAGGISSLILLGGYNKIDVLKEGLTPQTPLSGGKATYYASLQFN